MKPAIKAASLSDHINHKVGAALFIKRSLIAVGWNNKKTHPASNTLMGMQHAEFNCLVGNHKYDLVGATLFVARLTKTGRLGISKPCNDCENFLRASGISTVYYIGRNGRPKKNGAVTFINCQKCNSKKWDKLTWCHGCKCPTCNQLDCSYWNRCHRCLDINCNNLFCNNCKKTPLLKFSCNKCPTVWTAMGPTNCPKCNSCYMERFI